MTAPDLSTYHHPYACEEGSYYAPAGSAHEEYESWADYRDDSSSYLDPDLNLLFRWDVVRRIDDNDQPTGELELQLYFMGQRKAQNWSTYVTITEADQPEIRAWLAERAKTMAALWEPFLTVAPETP